MAKSRGNQNKSSAFKQVNKKHKNKKCKTLKNKWGKADAGIAKRNLHLSINKIDKLNQKKQIRNNKNNLIKCEKSRYIGKKNTIPLHVAIIPLMFDIQFEKVVEIEQSLRKINEESMVLKDQQNNYHINIPTLKARFLLHFLKQGQDCDNTFDILDVVKVSDFVVFILPSMKTDIQSVIADVNTPLLECIIGQGLPNSLFIYESDPNDEIASMRSHYIDDYKKGFNKLYHEFLMKYVPNPKIIPVAKNFECIHIYRQMVSQKRKIPNWLSNRPLMLASHIHDEPSQNDSQAINLRISGFLKESTHPFLQGQYVHIPELGDLKIENISAQYPDPYKLSKTNATDQTQLTYTNHMNEPCNIYKLKSEDLNLFSPMPIIDEVKLEGSLEEDEQDALISTPSIKNSQPSVAFNDALEVNIIPSIAEDNDSMSVMDFDGDSLKEAKLSQNERIVDGVETPHDIPAKVRFAKYRGLKSFKKSCWEHAKRDQPEEYEKILDFENFCHTRKHVMARVNQIMKNINVTNTKAGSSTNGEHLGREELVNGMGEGMEIDDGTSSLKNHKPPYSYFTLTLSGVSKTLYETWKQRSRPLIVIGLLPFEQSYSLLNFTIRRSFNKSGSDYLANSKDRLLFQSGFRRFYNCPIYSQHTNDDKHKFMKHVPNDTNETHVCSMFTNIMLTSVPLLVFNVPSNTGNKISNNLIATGSLLNINPQRIIIKRVVLSGQPYKINGHMAVIRFMFYNTDDINWFMPVELNTKFGKHGHIKESVGTHGYMKCTFNASLKSSDSVLMNLYKRMFPKWKQEIYI